MEAAMAFEATVMAISGNMHIDVRVIMVALIKSEVKFDLQGHWDCSKASEATKMTVLGKQQ